MRAPAPKTPPQRPAMQEPDEFDRLYRDHVDLIYRYAHRLCGETESAKDLVQETFLNAYQGLKDFRGEARVSTWLYTIASRACIRMRRKRKGEPEHELSLDEFVPTSEGEFRLQIPMDGLSPEEALQNKELGHAWLCGGSSAPAASPTTMTPSLGACAHDQEKDGGAKETDRAIVSPPYAWPRSLPGSSPAVVCLYRRRTPSRHLPGDTPTPGSLSELRSLHRLPAAHRHALQTSS